MLRPLLRRVGLVVALAVVLTGSFVGGLWLDQTYPEVVPALGGQQRDQLDRSSVNSALRVIRAHYYDPSLNYTRLSQGSVNGMVQALNDPYTQYLSPSQYRQRQDLYASRHMGVIGIYVVFASGRPVISGVLPGSPAQHAGLHRGDVILTIDGTDTNGMTSDHASALIRGRAGTAVVLGIDRQGHHLDVRADRSDFTSPTVQSARLESDVLYVRIYQFGDHTQQEFDDQLRAGLSGARGVVLDVRDNGGGYVSAATAVISRFVASGEAFETRGRDGVQRTQVDGNHPAAGIPLVVLVNGNSASASEIVAGSLQAHHRARLVGAKTFGKGSVQVDYPLPDGGDLHLTTQHWYLPDGRTIDHSGLQPDVPVALAGPNDMYDVVESHAGHGADAQLNAALNQLSR